jgi:hypothetical protein
VGKQGEKSGERKELIEGKTGNITMMIPTFKQR